MALLEVRRLEKWYGSRKVVDGVSFEVNPGEVVGLLGPNGAGKTTSFRMATGQITPNGGTVIFNGEDVTDLPMYRRARLGMGYLSQEQSIFRKLTVEQNLLAILEALPRSRTLGRRLTRAERWQRTEAALTRFNLLQVRKNVAAKCSGGEKRRLEIARCLVCEPLLILLDEPFAAVDPKTTEDIRRNVRDLANHGIGILLTDHNVREVVKTADRIYLIVEGKVVCHGTPAELIRDPVAIDAYLGSTFEDDVLMARVAGFKSARSDGDEPDAGSLAQLTPAEPPGGPAAGPAAAPVDDGEEPADDGPIPLGPDVWSSETHGEPPPPRVPPTRPAARAPAPPPTEPAPVLADNTLPTSPTPSTAIPAAPAPVPKLSGGVQQLLEQEKMRRLVEQLRDRDQMPAAWHELAGRGTAAVPILLEALERRELEVRHLAFRLLESVTGEQLAFQSDAPEEVRLRQVAYLRARLEKRAG
jgi:lipopolysaccharide export system ATP-binding protein